MDDNFTSKQRMLNAYKGIFSDRYPVAPEFWCYYPAKVLGVDMIEMERNIPPWKALRATFTKYGTEGWCAYYAWPSHPEVEFEEALLFFAQCFRDTRRTCPDAIPVPVGIRR